MSAKPEKPTSYPTSSQLITHQTQDAQRISDAAEAQATRIEVATEIPLHLVFNELYPFGVMMVTPRDLEDFALGFCLTEGITSAPSHFRACTILPVSDRLEARIVIAGADFKALLHRRPRTLVGRSGCGVCGSELIDRACDISLPINDHSRVSAAAIRRALDELSNRQPLNRLTGMVHAAAWASQNGEIKLVREDIGRHNALDKLIGAMHRQGIRAAEGFCCLTSRCSYEMVYKAVWARIPVVVAISAPSAQAITIAERANQTLIAIARKDSQIIFCGEHRITV